MTEFREFTMGDVWGAYQSWPIEFWIVIQNFLEDVSGAWIFGFLRSSGNW